MKGKLAFCSLGCLGLITEDKQKRVIYKVCDNCRDGRGYCTCETGMAYVGIHLTDKIVPIGSPWSSRTPRIIGQIRMDTCDANRVLVDIEANAPHAGITLIRLFLEGK